MNITEQVLKFFRKTEKETKRMAPEGLCELCWGYQQYDGKIRELIKDKQIDVNNHRTSYTFMEDFVKTNLEGIKLKEGEVKECPTCGCSEH